MTRRGFLFGSTSVLALGAAVPWVAGSTPAQPVLLDEAAILDQINRSGLALAQAWADAVDAQTALWAGFASTIADRFRALAVDMAAGLVFRPVVATFASDLLRGGNAYTLNGRHVPAASVMRSHRRRP